MAKSIKSGTSLKKANKGASLDHLKVMKARAAHRNKLAKKGIVLGQGIEAPKYPGKVSGAQNGIERDSKGRFA